MVESRTDRIQKQVGTVVEMPVLGSVVLPPREKLAFYAGLGLLAVFEIVEWPIALTVAAGHVLADQQHWRLAQGVGEALEEV
ncbi:hypothetical protein ACVGVM_08290 [Pseudonocardia bannensis]|uniref:Uncharacterized protein n=1 Tax=Pseudonocardia bannensis TaxID=630973 RepID=A0A848DCQ9_9PSEU|nr:hypothetical protein [Pseudonocardia bannensis]NMH90374.1 hypothetical protein [Pseudonocardia bannensis]